MKKHDKIKHVLQIDYAIAYQWEYQDEIQSALWLYSSVYLFTCVLTNHGKSTIMVICTDDKVKNKAPASMFLHILHQSNDAVLEEYGQMGLHKNLRW